MREVLDVHGEQCSGASARWELGWSRARKETKFDRLVGWPPVHLPLPPSLSFVRGIGLQYSTMDEEDELDAMRELENDYLGSRASLPSPPL
jgi:hypothetical protein